MDDKNAGVDDLLAFLCDVDVGDIPTDEWLFPPDKDGDDAQLVPALTLSGGAIAEATSLSPLPPPDAKNDPIRVDSDAVSAVSCSDAGDHALVLQSTPPKRRTRKEELTLLRDQVARMTHQLNSLKLTAGIGITTPVAAIPQDQMRVLTAVTAARAAQSCCLWEKLAAKQLKRRRDAEQENKMLRDAVTVHERRAKKLRQMLHKRAVEENRQLMSVVTRRGRPVAISLPDDEHVFQSLAEGMDEAYAVIDTTFREAKMHEVPVPGRRHSGQGFGPGSWRVDLRDVHVMPFEFERAERAAWVYFSNETDNDENELNSSIRFTFPLPTGESLSMHQRSVTRRYRERERTVVITRALTQPLSGISIDITRQMIITSGECSVSGPTTVIKTYLFAFGSATTEAVHGIKGELRLRDRQVVSHTGHDNFGLKLWEKSLSRVLDGIEDVLVEGSFDGRKPSR